SALARNLDPAPLLDRLAEENWKQVVLFYVAVAAPESAGAVMRELMERGWLDLAARAAAEMPRGGTFEDMREALAARLLPQAWQARDTSALASLALVEWQGANDFFAGRLKEGDPQARAFAATALGQLQNDEAVEPLLPLLRDPSAEVRNVAIAALAASRSELATEPLLAVLRGDNRAIVSDTGMRSAAARALGRLGSESAVPALLVDLRMGDRELREAAADALLEIRSDLAIEPLRELVQSQVPDEVRAAGHGILNIIG
ncbi:MAG: HEAT repeat domain-containing protein, partial [Rudaea sp.]